MARGFYPVSWQLATGLSWWGNSLVVLSPSVGSLGVFSLLGDFPAIWKGLLLWKVETGEYNTDGSVSLSLALLRCLFKCLFFAFQMVNVSVSSITANKNVI